MKKKIDISQLSPEELEAYKLRLRKKLRRKKIMTVIDRIFGFIMVTCIVFGCAALALEGIIIKGPSPSLKDAFTMTMIETRRFTFIPRIFLTEEEFDEIYMSNKTESSVEMDSSLIQLPSDNRDNAAETIDYGTPDEDGDGIVYKEIKGNGYAGHMLIILDPSRVFVGMPDSYGGVGLTLDEMCVKYGAVGGINAGGFLDDAGTGLGGYPDGLTIIDGVCYNEGYGDGDCFVGLDTNNLLWIGYYTAQDAEAMQIRDGVSFGPILVQNGEVVNAKSLTSGVNPRTAIGQRGDGAILMLVVDGRQAHSIGATYLDMAEVMVDHGAVNAINLDGGSSTVMWYEGDYINSCSAQYGTSRPLPNTFLIRAQ